MADSWGAGAKCRSCGAAVDSRVTDGLCPACLLRQVAFGTGEESLPAARSWLAPTLEELEPLFPQYELLEPIGQGGMGAVYKARQRSLGRLVALKVLAPELASNPDFAERFIREARALAEFNHPNIVTIHDFGKTGSLYFITMEFVDGVNLRQAMSTGRLTPAQALAIVPPICEALLYAHQHGVVHRDIKPENLLLDKEGRLKIADFGIARMLRVEQPEAVAPTSGLSHGQGELTQQSVVGTPQYMAPEQRDNPSQVDHRADIYALGVVLYEMLTGERPGAKFEAPSRKVQIDVRLDEIVLRALESKPELRYQTAGEFKTRVEALASGEAPTLSVSKPVPIPTAEVEAPDWRPQPDVRVNGYIQVTLGLLFLVGFPFFGGVVTASNGDYLTLVYLAAVFGGLAFPGIPVYLDARRQPTVNRQPQKLSPVVGFFVFAWVMFSIPLWQMFFKSAFFLSSLGQHAFLILVGGSLVQLIPLGLGLIHRGQLKTPQPPLDDKPVRQPAPTALRARGLVVPAEQLDTFWGQLFIHHCQGEFFLDDRWLRIHRHRPLPPGHLAEIPLSSIRDVSVDRYPAMVNLMGLNRVIVTYDSGSGIRQMFLTPSLNHWASLGDTNRHAFDWCEYLRAARDGRSPAVVPQHRSSPGSRRWVPAALIFTLTFLGAILFTSLTLMTIWNSTREPPPPQMAPPPELVPQEVKKAHVP